jgi:hypothetical protein
VGASRRLISPSYLTANAGLRLALIGIIPAAADRAADFLQARQQADGSIDSYLPIYWLGAALWQQTGRIDTAASTIDHLASRVPDLSAGNLAWMILALREGGVAADNVAVIAALDDFSRCAIRPVIGRRMRGPIMPFMSP